MSALDRLDDDSRRVLELAEEEARLLGHRELGDDHLLLGVARAEPDLVGVPIEALRARVVAGRAGQRRGHIADPRPGESFLRALEIADRDSEGEWIEPLDILAAIAAAKGLAAEALARIGVDSMGDAPGFAD